MGAVYFYHLTRRPLEAVLPQLLERALAQGWRVSLRARTDAMLDRLDDALWTDPPDGFLPHARDGGPQDAAQPILLTLGETVPEGRDCLICVEGAPMAAAEVAALARGCVIFDGGDAAALAQARDQWRALTGAGVAAQYWSEESGQWQKKAER
ncbi:DNA polymerase III subunit chi [Palleronia sediminis]|uniref:DNA polymerase III subunit chi n=1 Tax=Palleronia sediminis TaxID=2547833 RepID=A0A4R6A9D8_9RHOB|nr:DNA polymerase III subunit chi [Palleronia sediminis]TDL79495.1 DNA polymerase III subunit chi [Palleronia sediminis]